MLDHKGFDLWSDGYDADVDITDDDNEYPFAGYKKILGSIYSTIMCKPNAAVLDICFGTDTLTGPFCADTPARTAMGLRSPDKMRFFCRKERIRRELGDFQSHI